MDMVNGGREPKQRLKFRLDEQTRDKKQQDDNE